MNIPPIIRRNPINTLCVIALIALAALLVISRWQLARAKQHGEANALRADSIAAALDTSRAVALRARDVMLILGDSLQAVERRGVQLAALNRDALDKATRRTTVVRGGVTVTPGPISTAASGAATVDAGDVRHASFHVDSSAAVWTTRFTADVDVRIPPPPALASMRLGVVFAPMTLRPRVQCGEPDAGGVRPASLAVVAPVGVTLAVEPLEIDVHACNPDFGRATGVRLSLGQAGTLALVASALTAWLVTR